MPNVVDFSPLNQTVYDGRGSAPIIAALKGIAAQNMSQRQHEEQLAFQREQEQRRMLMEQDKTSHERQLEAAAQRKQQGVETVANNRGREQADQAIRAAVGIGDLAEAKRRSDAYSEVDPVTAKVVNGRGFQVNPVEGPAPPTPQPRPIEEGPQASPDEAANAGLIRGAQQAPGDQSPELGAQADQQQMAAAEAERQRFAQASTPDQGSTLQQQGNQLIDPQQVAVARQAAWRQQQANPAVTIGGVQTTPEAIRYSKSRADAADFGKLGEALAANHAQALQVGDPLALQASERRMQAFQEVMPLVQSGSMSPQAAQARIAAAATGADRYVDQSRLTAQRADDASGLQGQRDEASMARTRVIADSAVARDAAKVAAKKEATGGVDPKSAARFEGDLQHFQVNNNISSDRKDEARMATLLQNKDTSIVQRAIAGNLARGLGAERGVLTDKDISRLQGNLGGMWADVENWISKKDTGDLAPEVRQKLEEGIQIVLAEKAQARKQAEAAYMSTFGAPDSIYAGWGLGEHAKRKFKEIFGHDAPVPEGQVPTVGGQVSTRGGGEAPPGGVLQHNPRTGKERWKMPDGTYIEKK